MSPPTSLRIGGRQWSVEYPAALEDGAAGSCTYEAAELAARKDLVEFEKRDAVLHESMHAILYMQGHTSYGNAQEERFVRSLSTGLIGVLQDNPEFAKWLIAKIQK